MSNFGPINSHRVSESAGEYVTAEEIQKVFADELDGLFQLAFLLTGNADKAAYCVETTVRECMHPQWMLKDQIAVRVRSAVIRNGIRIVDELDVNSISKIPAQTSDVAGRPIFRTSFPDSCDLAGILDLNDFDRLVYVLCVLEHISLLDCAMVLGTTRQEVREAKARAVAHIAASACGWWNLGDSAAWSSSEWRAMQAMGSSTMTSHYGSIPN